MANKIFEVQGPNGKTYEVEAPDMETAASAASQMFQGGGQFDGAKPAADPAASGGFVEIPLPDGRTARLPKGMSRAEMAEALNKLPGATPAQPAMEQRKLGLLLEAERRGILPADKKALLDEARRRGLVPGVEQPQAPGMGQRVKEFFLGDNDPNTQNLGEKIGTSLNKAGEAMTFGLIGDEASGAAAGLGAAIAPGGQNFQQAYEGRRDFERQQEAVLERDNPGLALGAELGGAVAGAVTPLGAIGTLGRAASMPARVAASSAAGAGMAGTYGFTEGEGLENRGELAMDGAKLGALIGGVAPMVGAGVQRLADRRASHVAIRDAAKGAPTSAQLRAQGNAAYQAIDDANVQIRPEALARAREATLNNLRANTGFDELPGPSSLTPNSARTMQIMGEAGERMAQEPTAALPFRSLDQIRRQAGAAAGNVANKTDARAGVEIIQGLDDMVRNLGPDDVVSGDLQTLQEVLPKARDIWSRMSRSQVVDDAIEAGQNNYLSGGSSGIRNQFARILRNDKLSRGFSEAEKAAMRRVVNGSMPEQILNLLGGGLGQLGQIGAGFGLGGVPGAMAGAATAAVARKGSEALTSRNAEIVRALIANGGLQNLPVASDGMRRITEALLRRNAAIAGP